MNKYKFIGQLPIYTKGYIEVASNFTRIVHGGRGAYVEFADEQIIKDNIFIPEDQMWRFDFDCYYIEYRTVDKVKIYHQKKKIDYADYIVGMWYISPIYLQGFEKE